MTAKVKKLEVTEMNLCRESEVLKYSGTKKTYFLIIRKLHLRHLGQLIRKADQEKQAPKGHSEYKEAGFNHEKIFWICVKK